MSTIGDLAIVNRTTETAPKDYTVPGAQDVRALAVTAAIDGSGAAGSYLPCLQLLSPAGDVLWTARTASGFAAGQSVDVSWFARAGGITSSVSAGVTPDWATYFMDPVSVASGGRGSAGITQILGSALLTGLPNSAAYAKRGVYAISAWVQSTDAWTAGAVAGGRLYTNTVLTNFFVNATGSATPAGVLENFNVTLTSQFDAGDSFGFEYENFDTAARNMFSNEILVQLIYSY